MEYTIVLHPAEEGGFWVEVPALPGCFRTYNTMMTEYLLARSTFSIFIRLL